MGRIARMWNLVRGLAIEVTGIAALLALLVIPALPGGALSRWQAELTAPERPVVCVVGVDCQAPSGGGATAWLGSMLGVWEK